MAPDPVNTYLQAAISLGSFAGGLALIVLGLVAFRAVGEAIALGQLDRRPIMGGATAIAFAAMSAGSFYGAWVAFRVLLG